MSKKTCGAPRSGGGECSAAFGLCEKCGKCFQHCPHREEEREEARSRGGRSTARKTRSSTLSPEDLPPLVDHHAAEAWTDTIGRAAATGSMSSSAATAALRAIAEWRKAREAGAVSERLEALTDALAEWRKTGDPEPVLELVEGSK